MLKWLVTGREGGGRSLGDQEGKVTTTDDPLAVLEEGNPNYSQIYSVNRYNQISGNRPFKEGLMMKQ